MLHSSLARPTDSYDPPEPGYSKVVERRLIWAYRFLAAGSVLPDAYLRAHKLAFSCQGRQMSIRQRMRIFYVLGSALIAGEAPESGIVILDQALLAAELIQDWLAWAELAYLLGSTKSSVMQYTEASKYFTDGLSAYRAAFVEDGAIDTELEFDFLSSAAYAKYLSSDSHEAVSLLSAARTVHRDLSSNDPRRGSLMWMEALTLRWDDQPEEALVHAVQADAAYEQAVMPTARLSHGRLQTVITDIALDIVERLPTGSARDALLSFAAFLPGRASNVARGFDDEIGVHLAALAQARWDRLADRNVATHDALWHVVNAAERIGDVALLAQARTAWGHELVSRGWREAGLDQYRKTLRDLRFTEVPAMGKWARDKLIEASRQGW